MRRIGRHTIEISFYTGDSVFPVEEVERTVYQNSEGAYFIRYGGPYLNVELVDGRFCSICDVRQEYAQLQAPAQAVGDAGAAVESAMLDLVRAFTSIPNSLQASFTEPETRQPDPAVPVVPAGPLRRRKRIMGF